MKVLVADDDPTLRQLLKKALERAGFEVLEAENGRVALEHLTRIDGPRLTLLDWLMPEVDGLTLCREIRKRSESTYIYVILLTSRDSRADVVAGFEAGADDYLTKPCDPEELRARLRAGVRILGLQDKLIRDGRSNGSQSDDGQSWWVAARSEPR